MPPVSGPSWSIDGYDDFREIGRGGSATVYSASQIGLDRRVAIKVLHVGLHDAAARRRFERECAVLGALGDTPGVVAVHSAVFASDGRGCIVMQLMEGSLSDELRRFGPLDAARVRDIGIAVCEALSSAHARGIVHRDVKPGNLLVAPNGQVALGDFDIASDGLLPASTVTNDSLSPPHAPPERLTGGGPGSPGGDIWSLGSTLYTLLADRQPFGSATSPGGMAGLIQRVLNDPVPSLNRTDVPNDLEAVLQRAMAKNPDDRWPDAASMAEALAAVTVDPASRRGVDDPSPPDRPRTALPQRLDQAERTERPGTSGSSVASNGSGAPDHLELSTTSGRAWSAVTIAIVALFVLVAVAAALTIAFI